jgi:RimJ/RimL family protein N-acetyltransferase
VTGIHKIRGHKCELGYWIAEPFWGRGLATEAVRAVTGYAFSKLKLVRLMAAAYLSNRRSMRVLKKCGFKKEGFLRKSVLKDGRFYDVYLFAKIK